MTEKDKWTTISVGDVVTIKGAPAEVIKVKHNSIHLKIIGELGKSILPGKKKNARRISNTKKLL